MWIDCYNAEHKGGISLLLIMQSDMGGYCDLLSWRSDTGDYCDLLSSRSDTGGYCVHCLGGAIRVVIIGVILVAIVIYYLGRVIRVAIMILSLQRDKGGGLVCVHQGAGC